ncbi:MAG TPA: IclR family transcriptional regulator [Myxococcota bacterium]|jgi:DNA-binding IclR family transcriptional regulator|nr:IclR family transcriptional regulator [Myxococcota bacterium]
MKRTKSDYSIQTVTNALSLLEVFETEASIGVSELSRRLGLHKNNVFRLLATLEERGFVEQEPGGDRYRLSLRCFELGQAFVRSHGLLREAQPVLDALATELGESAHLAVLSSFEVVHLAAGQPGQILLAGARVGRRLPAHCTALGKALLAFAPEPLRQAYDVEIVAAAGLAARTARSITDREKLLEHLHAVASRGVAFDVEECERGVACAAAPVFDGTGRLLAAISVSGPSSRLGEDVLEAGVGPRVAAAAEALSARLGARPALARGSLVT